MRPAWLVMCCRDGGFEVAAGPFLDSDEAGVAQRAAAGTACEGEHRLFTVEWTEVVQLSELGEPLVGGGSYVPIPEV